jgi:hypothetical protein
MIAMSGLSFNAFLERKGKMPCGSLIIQTQLSSPREDVIQTLKKGDLLTIILLNGNGPCVATYNEKIAGTIINKDILTLIACLQKGCKFIAIVRNIIGGRCAITIKPFE